MKKKKKKREQAAWEEHRGITQACHNRMGKLKLKLKLKLARDMKENKSFYKQISTKIKTVLVC